MLKKIALGLMMLLGISQVQAQKIGVVDTQYILSQIPEYKEAEAQLNKQVAEWQEEIKILQSEFDTKKLAFENEKILLVGEEYKKRERELTKLDLDLRSQITLRFGSEGEINTLRENLVKPYQEKIWTTAKTFFEKNNLGIVIDKSNNLSVLFVDKKYDYTEKILEQLVKTLKSSSSTPKTK